MNRAPSPELLDAISHEPSSAAEDKLTAIHGQASLARDLDLKIQDLEQRLEDLKTQRSAVLTKTLPEMMDEVGVRDFTLEAAEICRQ